MRKLTLILSILILTFSGSKAQNTLGKLWGMTSQGGDSTGGVLFNYDSIGSKDSIVHPFALTPQNPYRSNLVQAIDGTFYGTTIGGGTTGNGTIFKYNATTRVFTILVNFDGTNYGGSPYRGLVLAKDGNLYGVTSGGGANGGGTIFQCTTSGIITVLYNLSSGDNVYGGLIQAKNGNLYGVSSYGGGGSGYGYIFQCTTSGIFTNIASFNNTNGNGGYGSLIQANDGNLYGMTYYGGKYSNGVIFKYDTLALTLDSLVSFNGTDGSNPYSGLIQATDGNLYGMTYNGGSNNSGVVFQCTLSGNLTVINNFSNYETPYGDLVQANGDNLYGMAYGGGSSSSGYIFQYNFSTPAFTDLADFSGTNGSYPQGTLIMAADGNLYGMTNNGITGYGTIFNCSTTGTLTSLYNFGASVIGNNPYGSVIQAADANVYGMTYGGGTYGLGTVFEQNTVSGKITTLASFNDTNGALPYGSLIQAKNGNFYGMTNKGGITNQGIIFKYDTAAKKIDTLASFTGNNGADPYGSLIQANDGNFYGMTYDGGTSGEGNIFKYDTTIHQIIDLVDFASTNGAYPYGSLIIGADGNFYGMTSNIASADGSLFVCTPSGTLSTLYSFSSGYPYGNVIQASDSNLYGMTYEGGTSGDGSIFKFNLKTNAYSDIVSFTNSEYPYGSLIQAADGLLYGMTYEGGSNSSGSLFKCTTTGTLTTLVNMNNTSGTYPEYGNLMEQMSGAVIDSLHGCAGVKLTARFRGAQIPFK
ncbi:MAG TPA: choice-of-anchor tandem repeat GloVer-containing protein, partial [Bacteroidia bacterium]|nr:choice-of-anchor tandem repeat GloVer-containing protein [Bacteroidia bacterium]